MKVLHIISGLQCDGAEMVLLRLILNTRAQIDHQVISLRSLDQVGSLFVEHGIIVQCVHMRASRMTWAQLRCLWKLIKNFNPDVVQTWMYHADFLGGIISRLAGYSAIVWGVRSGILVKAQRSWLDTTTIVRLCAWISYWIPRKIVICSEQSMVVHRSLGYRNQFTVIHNGYDFRHFYPQIIMGPLRGQLGLSPDTLLVGTVGRYHPRKDHQTLLRALMELKQAKIANPIHCILVGSDCDEGNRELVGWVNQYGLKGQVSLLGPRTDIQDIMNALDLYVMSSAFGEAFPNTVAEAMACGIPCVVTNLGDAPLIVGETGWVVEPKNEKTFAAAMQTALEERSHDVEQWQKRKAACVQRIRDHFSLDKMAEAYIQVWQEASRTEKRTNRCAE